MTLTDLRESVPMNIPELARAAGVDAQTIRNAESGQRISVKSARAIAQALSDALGRTIQVRDIEGLQVRLEGGDAETPRGTPGVPHRPFFPHVANCQP
jgi:transcriptional regulator with XRE-family HTH domain